MLCCKTFFPKKISVCQNADRGFFSLFRKHSELHPALVDIKDLVRGLTLQEDNLFIAV
jgi:hypothetical protein